MFRLPTYLLLGSFWSLTGFLEVGAAFTATAVCPNTDGITTICFFDPEWNCLRQDQCPDGYKCCPYGCGNECLAVSCSSTHPGSCPAQVQNTVVACLSDVTCKANEKCCNGYCVVVRPFRVPVISTGK